MQSINTVQGITHLLIMGDFNMKDIHWNEFYVDASDNSYSQTFFDNILDNYWFQHTEENTHFAEGCKPSLLDLVITNDINVIDEIETIPPLGKK